MIDTRSKHDIISSNDEQDYRNHSLIKGGGFSQGAATQTDEVTELKHNSNARQYSEEITKTISSKVDDLPE